MSHSRLRAAAIIIAFGVIASFIFSVPRARDGDVIPTTEELMMEPVTPVVTFRDEYKKGVHTITGSLEAPNACAGISAEASLIEEASTSRINVAISFMASEGVCLQLPTKLNFSTTISAPADVPITATVNGVSATTTAP